MTRTKYIMSILHRYKDNQLTDKEVLQEITLAYKVLHYFNIIDNDIYIDCYKMYENGFEKQAIKIIRNELHYRKEIVITKHIIELLKLKLQL